jgi:hypothetical protein
VNCSGAQQAPPILSPSRVPIVVLVAAAMLRSAGVLLGTAISATVYLRGAPLILGFRLL